MKRGTSPLVFFVYGTILMASLIILQFHFRIIPSLGEIGTDTLSSESRNSDAFVNTISLISFARSKTESHETVASLIGEIYEAAKIKDEQRFRKLHAEMTKAAKSYADNYEGCLALDLDLSKGEGNRKPPHLWDFTKENCKQKGTGAFADPSIKPISILIPASDPTVNIKLEQRFAAYETSYK